MRATWKGSIAFGRIAIPVGLVPARQNGDVAFRILHSCGQPIRQTRLCPEHGEVTAEDTLRGWEVAPGQFVPVTEQELDAIAADTSARTISIAGFVAREEIDPLLVDRPYYLQPAEEPLGRKPYLLLRETLFETDTVAVGRFDAWGRDNLAMISPRAPALILWTLHAAGDVRPHGEIEQALAGTRVDQEELDLARELAMKLFGPLHPEDLESRYRARVLDLLEAKLAGRQIILPEPQPAQVALPTLDLVAALKQSIRTTRRRRKPRGRRAH